MSHPESKYYRNMQCDSNSNSNSSSNSSSITNYKTVGLLPVH